MKAFSFIYNGVNLKKRHFIKLIQKFCNRVLGFAPRCSGISSIVIYPQHNFTLFIEFKIGSVKYEICLRLSDSSDLRLFTDDFGGDHPCLGVLYEFEVKDFLDDIITSAS